MTEVKKIVLTGGPCGGKTSAMTYLADELKKFNVDVFLCAEQATELMSDGYTPENTGSYEFHKMLFERQLSQEKQLFERAKNSTAPKAVIICDRGLLDSRAYVSVGEFERYAALHGLIEEKIRNSYDAVFHLVTAADGAEESYGNHTNPLRSETAELAVLLDKKLLGLWTGTTHLRVIDNRGDFSAKLKRLKMEVLAVLGIPEPLEIERKFLIEMPDINLLNSMETCRRIPITQAYLTTSAEGNFRIRKRGEGKDALYIKTVKKKISDIKRVEIENYISKKEYDAYMADKAHIFGVISKDRYCVVADNTYYELDVYPFWSDKATIEIELLSEDEDYTLPDFVKLIREVTFEKKYRNKQLALKYGYSDTNT